MAFKRVTIELDDVLDQESRSAITSSQHIESDHVFKVRQLTGDTIESDTVETTSLNVKQSNIKAPGRTFSDLVAEFKNNSQVMATVLMFIPFIPFASSIASINDLKYPLIIGILLNLIWFFVGWLSKRKNT